MSETRQYFHNYVTIISKGFLHTKFQAFDSTSFFDQNVYEPIFKIRNGNYLKYGDWNTPDGAWLLLAPTSGIKVDTYDYQFLEENFGGSKFKDHPMYNNRFSFPSYKNKIYRNLKNYWYTLNDNQSSEDCLTSYEFWDFGREEVF